ncbi:MAG: hypothetical protein EOO88_15625 [Pedobacter sp.]|nr:MAG: hypothetical protein EOO88_15625 [Pedobacter sp.]
MKKFLTVLLLATVASTGATYAQYYGDALRFSQTNYGSSARFKGLGGAQISLGGDISSLGGNPAGLGMFTRSEFSITPEWNGTTANARYLGTSTKDSKNQLNLNQAGIVWYNPIVKPKGADLNKGAVSVVWGLGYNRNNDFSSNFSYGGKNANNSIADYYSEIANGLTPNQFVAGSLEKMAYDNFLIDELAANNTLYQPATSLNNDQRKYETREGSTSELNFSGAVNLSNQLYLGASIGLVNMRYNSNSEYLESGTNISTNPQNDMIGKNYTLSYRQNQVTDGSGINGRLGLIFKPTSAVRLGATVQTPTWMHIQDSYSEVLDTRYTGGGTNTNFTNNTQTYAFEYNLRTPFKGSVGASAILGGNALISADVDYIDYSTMKFSATSGFRDYTTINQNNSDVKANYTSAVNFRVGGEYKIDQISVRAGFGLNGSPIKNDTDNDFQTKVYSGGLGYRHSNYYIDLAYQRAETNYTTSPYTLADLSEPVANIKVAKNNLFLTVGVRF